jgi:hypothetical protein
LPSSTSAAPASTSASPSTTPQAAPRINPFA